MVLLASLWSSLYHVHVPAQWKRGVKTTHDPGHSGLNSEVVLILKQGSSGVKVLVKVTLIPGVILSLGCSYGVWYNDLRFC